MRVSVIVSTYNSPDWLEKVLWGYSSQTTRDFEIVVADDGSRGETRERIESLRDATGLEIRHVWHEDRGFRKCTILNKAVLECRADYLLFTDGDCIPRHDFVDAHLNLAEPGYFLSGGTYRLPLEISRAITREDIDSRRINDPGWLSRQGLPTTHRLWRMGASWSLAAVFDQLTTTVASFNGHNTSCWKSDLLAVNGFDERMEYGAEDRELGERMLNRGVRVRQIRHRAITIHLDHERGYIRREALERNRQIRQLTHATRATWTDHGVLQHVSTLNRSA